MSKPQNELGRFRSYAYHHILMVCNSTETANELTNTSEITKFQHPVNDKKRYTARQVGDNEKNKYITLIDGTSDARFFIINASWENIIAMEDYIGDGNIPQSTSMSLEGELEIVEPMGANFLNVLTNTCDTLDTDPVGLLFVLKTIFVGHNDDGTTEMISNIKPLLFINYDITAVFDSAGAKYKMIFVGAVNGIGKLPHTQQIVNGFQFGIPAKNTLIQTFEDISGAINNSYDGFLKKAEADYAKSLYEKSTKTDTVLTAAKSKIASEKFFEKYYRKVQYKIIATDYKDTKYIAGDNDNVRVAGKLTDTVINFGNNTGIETIIKKIMASSVGVINDGKADAEGKKYIYKISSGLQSTEDGFLIEYYVNRYEMLMLPYDAAFNGVEYNPPNGQSIEFNYIFTGKNVDIKEFDIKMEMGMAFFQIAATTDSYPTAKNTEEGLNSSSVQTTGSRSVASKNKKKREKTPLFLGSKMSEKMIRNTKNPIDSASFQALLNRHAALENVAASMTIYGNLQLLGEMQILPSDLIKDKDDKTLKPKKDKTINPLWTKTPTLIKVNIKMPVDANDVNTEYDDFWYTGYYTLFAVKQIFNQGEFTQELDMLSMPVAAEISETADKPPTQSEAEKKKQLEKDKVVFAEISKLFGIKPKTTKKEKEKEDDVDKKTVKQARKRGRTNLSQRGVKS